MADSQQNIQYEPETSHKISKDITDISATRAKLESRLKANQQPVVQQVAQVFTDRKAAVVAQRTRKEIKTDIGDNLLAARTLHDGVRTTSAVARLKEAAEPSNSGPGSSLSASLTEFPSEAHPFGISPGVLTVLESTLFLMTERQAHSHGPEVGPEASSEVELQEGLVDNPAEDSESSRPSGPPVTDAQSTTSDSSPIC
ncbi:hypothetical protein EIP91_002774 [Steccherinum ochraceum]|uniref:Uncharacterized protein n=1 Tax=Steccherinum ochraceum TaxID=92696 RepID=A0A4R0RE04_9APHY|nr:hypothetical protein EIP91_002774 [Steccherinum ochraceum]